LSACLVAGTTDGVEGPLSTASELGVRVFREGLQSASELVAVGNQVTSVVHIAEISTTTAGGSIGGPTAWIGPGFISGDTRENVGNVASFATCDQKYASRCAPNFRTK